MSTMQLLTIIFLARVIQALGMAATAHEAFSVADRWKFRPRLYRWLWRSGVVIVAFIVAVLGAAVGDSFNWHGIIWLTPAVNAAFWVLLFLHVRATRRAAQRSNPAFVDGLSLSCDNLLADMERSRDKATNVLRRFNRSAAG